MELRGHFRELGKDVFVYGIFSALSRSSGLIVLPLLTRLLSVEAYGLVDLFATFVALASIGFRLALPTAINRLYHDLDSELSRKALVSSAVAVVLLIGLTVTIVAWTIALAVTEDFLGPRVSNAVIPLGCGAALLHALMSIPQAVQRLERKIVSYNLVHILNTGLYLGLTVVAVWRLEMGVMGVFLSQVVALLVSAGVALWLTRRLLGLEFSGALLRRALLYSLPWVPGILITWVNEHSDRLILLWLSGLGAVAIFGVASKVALLFHFAAGIFRQAWQPYSMTLIRSEQRDEVARMALDCYIGLFAIVGLAFAAIAPELIALLAPPDYQLGKVLVPWLVGAALLHHSSSITSFGVVISERSIFVLLGSLVCFGVNVIVSVALILTFGLVGAAVGSFLAQAAFASFLLRLSLTHSDV